MNPLSKEQIELLRSMPCALTIQEDREAAEDLHPFASTSYHNDQAHRTWAGDVLLATLDATPDRELLAELVEAMNGVEDVNAGLSNDLTTPETNEIFEREKAAYLAARTHLEVIES
jgi:hypothetical protein